MMHCILCKSQNGGIVISEKLWPGKNPSAEFLEMIKKYHIRRCEVCGHTQLNPLPTIQEDKEFYEKDTHTKEMFNGDIMRQKLERDTRRRADLISGISNSLGASPSVLDFGCGFGHLVGELSIRGFNATGVDVSNYRLDLARQWSKGEFSFFDPELDFDSQFDSQYDVVCAFHVLEHLSDPVLCLKQYYSLIKPGGYLVLEMPNAGDPMLKLLPSYNEFFWQRIHLSYFDASRLELAITRAGCPSPNIQFTQRYGLENLFHWVNHAGPELGSPSFKTSIPALSRAEEIYRRDREETGTADTLIAIVEKPEE
jgi:2-polyprenyl-3-methyl-5-hydroxy-6-metoxy-1,4-benzoquinol methylase